MEPVANEILVLCEEALSYRAVTDRLLCFPFARDLIALGVWVEVESSTDHNGGGPVKLYPIAL